MGSRAKRVESPGRKATAPTASGGADGGGLDRFQGAQDGDEGDQEADGAREDERDERPVPGGRDDHEDDRHHQDGGAGEQELQPSDALPGAQGQQSGLATAALTRAPVPSAMDEARSS